MCVRADDSACVMLVYAFGWLGVQSRRFVWLGPCRDGIEKGSLLFIKMHFQCYALTGELI